MFGLNKMELFWVLLTIVLAVGFAWFGFLKKEEELPLHLLDDDDSPQKTKGRDRPYKKIKGLGLHQKKGSTWLGDMFKRKGKRSKFRK